MKLLSTRLKLPTNDLLQELLAVSHGPCLSLYQPTHRTLPDNLQDPIRYKNLVRRLGESLNRKYPASETEKFIEPFYSLAEDPGFWKTNFDGLAVMGAPGIFEVIGLHIPVRELTIVADSFHLKPLRQYLQSADRYQILGISLNEIQLFEGNRHILNALDMPPGIPGTIEDALGNELTENYITPASFGGAGRTGAKMQFGQGSKKDEVEKDTERFFRVIDKHITAFSKESGLPLIIAALPEHHNIFQKISHNPYLYEKGIPVNPKSVTDERLRTLAWELLEPEYIIKITRLAATFKEARSHGFGSDDLKEVAAAAAAGRIDTLLTEENRMIPGRLINDRIETGELIDPDIDDLIDDIGELATKKGGKVMVVQKQLMPGENGIAAIYRY